MDEAAGGDKRRHSTSSQAGPSGTNSPNKTPRLDRTEDDEFDERIHSILKSDFSSEKLNPITAAFLLSRISRFSPNIKEAYQDLDNARQVIKDNDLVAVFDEAWQQKKFARIRNLEVLQAPPPTQVRTRRVFRADTTPTERVIARAWGGDYRGDAHRLLYDNINWMNRIPAYSNFVSIIQSSGSGKSRMVDEQAKLVFTIPFNLRPAVDSENLAFPPADNAIRGHLKAPGLTNQPNDVKQGYFRFFSSLFSKVTVAVKKLPQHETYEDLATAWRRYLGDKQNRVELYDAVTQIPDLVITSACRTQWNELHSTSRDEQKEPVEIFAAKKNAQDALDALILAVDELVMNPGSIESTVVKIMLYFDEFHVLALGVLGGTSLYDEFCSCIADFSQPSTFFIFLSTASNLDLLAPSKAAAKSARARNMRHLQAPITETPFDCSPDLPVQTGQLTLADLGTAEFMSRFGRPLFWTMLQGVAENRERWLQEIILFARFKLICDQNLDQSFHALPSRAQMAVLDLRLMLDFEPHCETTLQAENDMVESHMRMAYSIPEHRQYMRSGYPSEPLLAEAAAQQMNTPGSNIFSWTYTLMGALHNGLLQKCGHSQLVARLLVTKAYDRAVAQEHGFKPGSTNYSRGVSLMGFIGELFEDEQAEKILESVPDNVNGEPFREAFAGAIVRFTHFAKMGDETGSTAKTALAAFIRGMAIMCCPRQRAVGMIIPILFPDAPFGIGAISGLLVQIRDRVVASTVHSSEIDERKINFFPQPSAPSAAVRPYISLVMELGVQPKAIEMPAERPGGSAVLPPSSSGVRIIESSLKHHADLTAHPRYNIFAYGCSSTVYKDIGHEEAASYAVLVRPYSFLDEHPRQDDGSLSAVRRMKPIWWDGYDYFGWMEFKGAKNDAGNVADPGKGAKAKRKRKRKTRG